MWLARGIFRGLVHLEDLAVIEGLLGHLITHIGLQCGRKLPEDSTLVKLCNAVSCGYHPRRQMRMADADGQAVKGLPVSCSQTSVKYVLHFACSLADTHRFEAQRSTWESRSHNTSLDSSSWMISILANVSSPPASCASEGSECGPLERDTAQAPCILNLGHQRAFERPQRISRGGQKKWQWRSSSCYRCRTV